MLSADIVLDSNVAGRMDVVYTQVLDEHADHPFLAEEQQLLNAITSSIGHHIFLRRRRATVDSFRELKKPVTDEKQVERILSPDSDLHWKWRRKQAERIAGQMDLERFGVQGVYLIGSAKNYTAGPRSDIDLLIHFTGSDTQREMLSAWLEGWSLALTELSFIHSGYRPAQGVLDVHIITDEDIRKRTSYAVMIGSLENSARPLKVRAGN